MGDHTTLVLGATGQQGRSVAEALVKAGYKVRAFIRDRSSERTHALRALGAEIVEGDFRDPDSIRDAMRSAHDESRVGKLSRK